MTTKTKSPSHPLNHVRFRALSCTLRGAGPTLSPEGERGKVRGKSNSDYHRDFVKSMMIKSDSTQIEIKLEKSNLDRLEF
jgi:hypothetical protein